VTDTLFDAAAERVALETGRPLSQARLELEHPSPAPPPDDGLFAKVPE